MDAHSGSEISATFADRVGAYLREMARLVEQVDPDQLTAVLAVLWQAWDEDRTVFLIGNGGSAATASHMAIDLSKQTQVPGRRPLRAHALTDHMAMVTALANDGDYSHVFAEQLRIHARPGDVLVCLSASGNSGNVLASIDEALTAGLRVIGFGGFDGGRMRDLCDVYVHVPAGEYGRVETVHLLFDHCLTSLLSEYGRHANHARPAVFVDRDGVVNRVRPDHVKSWAEVELIPGAIDALAMLSRAGHRVMVVTNQSAIGAGLVSSARVERIHDRLAAMVAERGGRIEAFLVCPHGADDGCTCRKPRPGLLERARDRMGVDLRGSVLVGDQETDVEAARSAGARSILVLTGRAQEGDPTAASHVAADLVGAARLVLAASAGQVAAGD